MNKTWDNIPLVKPPKATRIPDVLSIEQLNRLFAATKILSYKVFFFTIYSMGLRLGEGVNLTVGDIDSESMRVHIRDAKGNKDRFVPLPKSTLHVLKNFWSVHRHPLFIFPSRKRGVKNARLVDKPLDGKGYFKMRKRHGHFQISSFQNQTVSYQNRHRGIFSVTIQHSGIQKSIKRNYSECFRFGRSALGIIASLYGKG